jgi:hypothetical protein
MPVTLIVGNSRDSKFHRSKQLSHVFLSSLSNVPSVKVADERIWPPIISTNTAQIFNDIDSLPP